MSVELRDLARGRWRSILPAIGVPAERLNGKHGPCPLCGQGKDRFRFDDKEGRGTWHCNRCGAGDGISLVQKIHGVDFRGAAELIKLLIGVSPYQAVKQSASSADDMRRWRHQLWAVSRRTVANDPAGCFLHKRVGISQYPQALRYHPNLEHRDEQGRRSRYPAMLAMISDASGQPAHLHRTYLTSDGRKADVAEPRKLMPGDIPAGAAIRLSEPAEVLGVAEGIETALAATALTGIACWSAINAINLTKWLPPAETRRVIIFGDNDDSFAGQAAAYTLARSIDRKGVVELEVRIPEKIGDWNDVLLQLSAAGRSGDG